MVVLISLLTVVSTFLGGLLALKFKDKLHLILGFSAGAVLGVAFFDLLPESIDLASKSYSTSFATSVVALGFILFMLMDRYLQIHKTCDECENKNHRGTFGAATLSVHSFLDGVIIGLGFQVSISFGLIVTVAVLAHDFSDGINTVNVVLKNKGDRSKAIRWLVVDALAPLAGATSTLFFSVPDATLGLILTMFCGFFLYIGASDILPESHHAHPTIWTTVMTLLGFLFLYGAIKLANI